MARVNKIKKWGLEREVLDLKRTQGLSYEKVAEEIAKTHPEIPKKQLPSHMSVKRFIDSYTEQDMVEAVEAGKAVGKIEEEFKLKMRELLGETESLKEKTNSLLDKAISEEASYNDLVKIIQTQNKNLDQIRKNMISLIEYSDQRFLRPIEHIQEKKVLQINQIKLDIKELMFKLSGKLCSKCRRVVGVELEDVIEIDD
jgi:hypothetical protein